jgi:hypothetical protein
MKTAYLVLSDLHFSCSAKENRYDYDMEIIFVVKKALSLMDRLDKGGVEFGLIFLGDIFDRGYKSPTKLGVDISILETLMSRAKLGVFSVVGNHEVRFWSNNPFWILVSSVDSERLRGSSARVLQPLGYVPKIGIVDRLEVGDCVFHFNHFGCADSPCVVEKVNIAFYHKDVGTLAFLDELNVLYTDSTEVEKIMHGGLGKLLEYDFSFVGHMHVLYGKCLVGKSEVRYLGSLGRPNKAHLSDDFLERNIPIVLFEDDKFVGIEDNVFDLMRRDECLIPEIDKKEKESYEIVKSLNEAKSYSGIFDNPMDNVRAYFANDEVALLLLEKLGDGSVGRLSLEIADRLSQVRTRRIRGE